MNELNQPDTAERPQARKQDRVWASGWATRLLAAGRSRVGRLMDLSLEGAGVSLQDAVPARTRCVLEWGCFLNGQRHAFSVQAESVYSVLVSGKGFRVGVDFSDAAIRARIASILE